MVAVVTTVGHAIVIAHPRPVRDLARATGPLAQTDALDAQVLAQFAQILQPPVRPWPDTSTQQLRALVAWRRHRVATQAQLQTWCHRTSTQEQTVCQQLLEVLATASQAVDPQHEALRQVQPAWQCQDALLQSVPGVGPVLSSVL